MRVLIVGAGVAGLTLAGRLCQQGRTPVVIEVSTTTDAGYALGLYPLGACVLHGLGSYPRLLDQGLVVEQYRLADRHGRVLQRVDMSRLTGEVGPMVMIGRSSLLELLEESCTGADIRRGVTLESLSQDAEGATVVLSDRTQGRFDAVVVADGINSPTRHLAFAPPIAFDSGWTLLTWWSPAERFDADTVTEWWGRGSFFGEYPTRGRVMCAAGGPSDQIGSARPEEEIAELLAETAGAVPAVAAALADLDRPYLWAMRDGRAQSWVEGRVALCGDAAVGFLPTAGVGASNAMRCAAGLADELSRAGPDSVALALQLYEKRCRETTEANQTESRRLARLMFMANRPGAWLRDRMARWYPAERMLGQIIASSHRPF